MTLIILQQPTSLLLEEEVKETVVVEQPSTVTVTENTSTLINQESSSTLLTEETVRETIVLGGVQGPPGIPGNSTQTEYHVAGTTLGGGRAVVLNDQNKLVYPDPSNIDSWCLGITKTSALTGELVEVQVSGTLTEPAWTWTPSQPVFLSSNGNLTQIPPTTGQIIVLGIAPTSTKLFVDIKTPIWAN